MLRVSWPNVLRPLRYMHRTAILLDTAASDAVDGPSVTPTNRAEATKRRFWKHVDIEDRDDALTVTLDKRALKTPDGKTLLFPRHKRVLASLIAHEWDTQKTVLQSHSLPMTSLASRAIDGMNDENTRSQVCAALLKYLDTDTVCFHQDFPPQLVDLQSKHWDPLLDWARSTFDVEIKTSESILFSSQPDNTKASLAEVIAKFDSWELAAFERATYLTKSFIIALALVKRHLTAEQAAEAALVEVNSQIQRWGEVEDTHDVDYHDVRKHLGSATCLLSRA